MRSIIRPIHAIHTKTIKCKGNYTTYHKTGATRNHEQLILPFKSWAICLFLGGFYRK